MSEKISKPRELIHGTPLIELLRSRDKSLRRIEGDCTEKRSRFFGCCRKFQRVPKKCTIISAARPESDGGES